MKLTIVTPTLNAERWLEECLASVRRESASTPGVSVRHLVVDCGSADRTVPIAERAGADVLHVERRGLFYQINQGYRSADADVIGYLGGDDLLLPGAVAEGRRWYERDGRAEWLVGAVRWTDGAGRPLGDLRAPSRLTPQGLAGLGWCCIPHQATFVTSRLFHELGGFDETFRYVGDHDFFIRSLRRFPNYDRSFLPLATYRRHGENVSMSGDALRERERERILNEYAPTSGLRRGAKRLALKLWLNLANPKWFLHKKAPALARRLSPPAPTDGSHTTVRRFPWPNNAR